MKNFKDFNENSEKYESISIEVLGIDNIWRRVEGGITNNAQYIARALNNTKKRYPNNRIRAVGQITGRFYDMVP